MLTASERWLIASFPATVRACSWAIVGGRLADVDHVAWCEVHDSDLRPPVDARRFLSDRLRGKDLVRAVGLLTSRSVPTLADGAVEGQDASGWCIATVGLGNAGDPAGIAGRIGTITILVQLSTSLTDEGRLEASAIATEAKTAAVLEAGVLRRRTGRPATGTGTDCTVVACTRGSRARSPKGSLAGRARGWPIRGRAKSERVIPPHRLRLTAPMNHPIALRKVCGCSRLAIVRP